METKANIPEVFVLVPSYNHGRYVEECLRSIFKQSVKPHKLLVIDDGSRDESVKVIEKVLQECPFDAEFIARENKGLCKTLNEGLEKASGDYFAYLGSDDLWAPSFIERRVALLETRTDAVLGYGHAYLIDENDCVTDTSEAYTDSWAHFPDGDPWSMLRGGTAPVSSTVIYRLGGFGDLRWNEDARLEDYEMYMQLSAKGEFAFDPSVLSAWRRHGKNTSDDSEMMLSEILSAQQRVSDAGLIPQNALEDMFAVSRFRFAREALQRGRKAKALTLARGSYHGARSFGELAAFGLRMAIPMGIVRLRRKVRDAGPKADIKEIFGLR